MIKYFALFLSLIIVSCTANDAPADWNEWKQSGEDGYVNDELAVLKAVDYRYITVGSQIYVVQEDGAFALSLNGAGALLTAGLTSGRLTIASDAGEAVYDYSDLPTDSIALSDTQRLRFNLENITHEEKRVRAILYDDEAKALSGFPGLTFFGYDPAGIITAAFEADPDMPKVILDTERGLTKAFYRAGYAHFSIEDVAYKMPLYTGTTNPDAISSFFTGFVDETTGSESYGTGRYVPISDFDTYPPSTLFIDFNYSYNPYCARSEAYNCPVIDFAIDAPMRFGEAYEYGK